ncbi:uncharacterized protein LOC144544826 [Carex rostrata]
MARLDRFLISADWNSAFPNSMQRVIANTSSDHCPLLFIALTNFKRSRLFRFENLWLRCEDFKELVKTEWTSEQQACNSQQLHSKLTNLQHKIKAWSHQRVGNIKSQITTCREFLEWIEKAKELRPTTRLERLVTTLIKQRHMVLAVLEEDLWCQRARINWELQGDRGTRYFHAVASGRRRVNCISQIQQNSITYSDHNTKAKVFFEFFKDLMGTEASGTPDIHWPNLYPEQTDLHTLYQSTDNV